MKRTSDQTSHDARNEAMVVARRSGKTYAEIGREFGVSLSRAQQVVKSEERRQRSLRTRQERYQTWDGPVDEMPLNIIPSLSDRTRQAFWGITIGEVRQLTNTELVRSHRLGIGRIALDEIRAAIQHELETRAPGGSSPSDVSDGVNP